MNHKLIRVIFLVFAMPLLVASTGLAQSIISGEITGVVTDISGAVVPNLTVHLTSKDTGVDANTTTSSTGSYRFALLRPGNYDVSVSAPGFADRSRSVVVALGQVTTVHLQLNVLGGKETLNVTAEAPLLHTENANLATTYDSTQIDLIPSPGQDITNYAMTAPGVALSTGAGYGGFTAFGLPGTSNLFTVNGNDYNDPYFNLNNSGASNLLLGANELQEVSVVSNGYTGEYGRMAGANVNYTTKSGTNAFHGNAVWDWNGRYLNANDWFNNNSLPEKTPRPFANSNQWAGSFGGPILKNKLYFFYDNEGLRYVLPGGGGAVYVPTAEFANATLANVASVSPASLPFYQNMMKLYAGAPGVSRATPVTQGQDSYTAPDPVAGTLGAGLGCGDLAGMAVPGAPGKLFGLDVPCARTFRSTVNNLNTERLQTIRVDWNAAPNDKVNFRYKGDRGVQATGTDPINPVFNANSVQPEDDGQVNWTHVLNTRMVNQFIASGLWYSALFGPTNLNASLAAFPTTAAFNDGLFTNLGGNDNIYPQGRNVTQYQIVDDFSWTRENHGIKFGVNYRRNDISSFASGPGTSGLITVNSITDFYNATTGGGTDSVGNSTTDGTFAQTFANAQEQPIAYYSLGLYFQDEWRLNNRLKLTLALRADRNSNEVCQTNCFARPASQFASLDHSATTPYNKAILTGQHQSFPSLQSIAWGPRVGFAWSPMSGDTMVIRGGFGLFSDLYPGFLADRFITNAPNVSTFTINSGAISPAAPGNVFSQAAASNAAFHNAFANGGTLSSIRAILPGFTAPNINSVADNISNPKYLEWNLQVEKAIGNKMSASLNYVGNHGYNLFYPNAGVNTYCSPAKCPNGFASLPSSAPDPRFRIVTQLANGGISNYNGVTGSLTRKFANSFSGTLNYTWSHSLDDLSNGGLLPYSTVQTSDSLRVQIDPQNLNRLNYGSSDYDFRHSLSANYLWELPFKSTNLPLNLLIGGWAVSGTFFSRSGGPFSVYNSKLGSFLGNGTSDRILAVYNGGGIGNCSHPSFDANTALQCLNPASFASSQFSFGNVSRNHFRGPGYFNSDFSVQKSFRITESGLAFTMGANAYNVFNHPNFGNPVGNLALPNFGQLTTTVTPPNSPYGNFQGAAVSGRVLQLDMKLKF